MKMDIRNIDRIYVEPMNENNLEFIDKNYLQVLREYFANDLINKYDCKYYFEKKGISFEVPKYNNILILFRMSNKIISSAILNIVERYSDEYKEQHPELKYNNGAYILAKDIVLVFEPIDEEELRKFMEFGALRQNRILKSKNEIDLEGLNNRINDNGVYKNRLLSGEINVEQVN